MLFFSHLQAVLPFHSALGGVRADPLAHAGHQVADGLRGRDDVEGRRQRALVIKVAQPQLGAGKLPLLVLVILQKGQKCEGHGKSPRQTSRNTRPE